MIEDLLAAALFLMVTFGVATAWIAGTWATDVLYALAFLAGAAWALARLFRPKPVSVTVPAVLLGLVAAWCAAQVLFGATVNRWASMNAALMWTANAVVFLLALQLFSKASRREAFLRALLYGGAALSLEALLQLYTAHQKIFWVFGISERSETIMGPIPYHNHFAAIVALVLPIAVYIAFSRSGHLVSHGWMVALLAGAVFASASRSGSVLVLLELAALVPFIGSAHTVRGRWLRLGAMVLLVALGGAVAGWERLWERMQQGDNTRVVASRASLEMISQRPLLGYGLGTWPSVYPMFAHSDDGTYWNQGHNDWLQWAAEGGIAFALLLAAFAVLVSLPAWRLGWGAGVPAVFLLAFVDFPLQKPAVSMLLCVLAGAVSAAAPGRRTQQIPPQTSPDLMVNPTPSSSA